MTEPLLPCPFCGSKAFLAVNPQLQGITYQARCTNEICNDNILRLSHPMEEAITLWNTRYMDPKEEIFEIEYVNECAFNASTSQMHTLAKQGKFEHKGGTIRKVT